MHRTGPVRDPYRRISARAAIVVALAAAMLVAPALPRHAWAAIPNGNPIYQAGNNHGWVNVYGADNSRLDRWWSGMNGGDQFTAGDVDGDGVEELLVLGDVDGTVTVIQHDGRMPEHDWIALGDEG